MHSGLLAGPTSADMPRPALCTLFEAERSHSTRCFSDTAWKATTRDEQRYSFFETNGSSLLIVSVGVLTLPFIAAAVALKC